MEKETESKSKKLQITFNSELVAIMEKKAEAMGVSVNQYITFLIMKDIEKDYKKNIKISK